MLSNKSRSRPIASHQTAENNREAVANNREATSQHGRPKLRRTAISGPEDFTNCRTGELQTPRTKATTGSATVTVGIEAGHGTGAGLLSLKIPAA